MRVEWVVGVALVACAGCAFFEELGSGPAEPGEILFDAFGVETEWGYKLTGFYIDEDGTVWRYDHDEPWFPASQKISTVREIDLLHKVADAVEVGTIDAAELAEKTALILKAAEGRVTRERISLERSGNLKVAYLYQERDKRYQVVFLSGGGEWIAKNHSKAARDLARWLGDVDRRMPASAQ